MSKNEKIYKIKAVALNTIFVDGKVLYAGSRLQNDGEYYIAPKSKLDFLKEFLSIEECIEKPYIVEEVKEEQNQIISEAPKYNPIEARKPISTRKRK